MSKLFVIVFSALIIISCKKEDADNSIIYGYEYFPTSEGTFVTYQVTDIFHDLAIAPQHDTNRYQIKEVVFEKIVDLEGDTIQKLKRFIRTSDTLAWSLQDVWTMKLTPRTAEVVEENDRVIRMIFAIAYDRTWDCNALNNEDAKTCYYQNIYEAYSTQNFDFDSTVIVEKENFATFIDYKRSYEVYARNIGRVKSVVKDLQIDNSDTTDIQKGSEIFYELIDYGVE